MGRERTGSVRCVCERCGRPIETGTSKQIDTNRAKQPRQGKQVEYCKCRAKSPLWIARFTFTKDGKRYDVRRRASNKTEAKQLLKDLLRELDDHGSQPLLSAKQTFSALADYYESTYLTAPVYVHGRKVSGLRSYLDQQSKLKTLRTHFGDQRLRDITPIHLERFKADRLRKRKRRKKGEKVGGQRSIAGVHRELALLRRMLNVALANGWIIKNPFARKSGLISVADERKRERILTREEEARLLAACTGLREHLAPILVCALDTGMRRGEILKLKWIDVDFAADTITVREFNTKTMQERQIAMTERLKEALEAVFEKSTKASDALVFGIKDGVRRSFVTARKAAGLPDVRFHDLRHTAASRLIRMGVPLNEVGKLLGHTQANTTLRYINANVETARRAATALDQFNQVVIESAAIN